MACPRKTRNRAKGPGRRRCILARCVAGFALLLSGPVFSQAPNFIPIPELTHLSPLGGQRGTTVEVTATGQHLDGATTLLFADPGITSSLKKDAPNTSNTCTFTVRLPAATKPGRCDARLHGKFGLSNPRAFIIGTLAETSLPTIATAREKATPLAMNTVVNSSTSAGARAWFKLNPGAAQRVFINLESPDTRLEPRVSIADATGRTIRQFGVTETADFQAEAHADYFVEVHDLLYRGGADHRFRLSASSEAPPQQRTRSMAGAFTDDAEIGRINGEAVKHLNDATPHELPLAPPCEYISVFPAGGKPATFTFNAKKGDVWWIDVLSHRLGHATAPALVLERIEKQADGTMKGAFISEGVAADPSSSATGFNLEIRDCALRFEAKNDALCRVKLRDGFNTSPNSPRLPFRLAIRRETPDFRLIAVPDQPPRARAPTSAYLLPPTLRRGGIASLRVFVRRQDGFAGEITLKADGLPPGVTCPGAILGNGDESTSLTFLADEKAAPWAGFVRIFGTARIKDGDVQHEARAGGLVRTVNDTRQDSFQCRLVDGIALAVIADEAPVLLDPQVDGAIEAKPGDKIKFDVKVVRRGGYEQPLKLRPFVLGDPEKSAAIQLDAPAKADKATIEINLASLNVKPGWHTFVLTGPADRVKYKKNADEIPAAEAEVKRLAEEAAKASAAAKGATGEAAKDATQKVKAAEQAKAAAEKRAKDLAKQAEPKDMTFPLWSKPVKILIKEETKK